MTLADFDGARAGQGGRYGPSDSVLLADGVLFADDRPFAKLEEETFVWNLFETGTSLRNILIEPDPGRRHRSATRVGRRSSAGPTGDGEVDHRPYSAGEELLLPRPPDPTDADEANELL